jgi:ribonuclease HIII
MRSISLTPLEIEALLREVSLQNLRKDPLTNPYESLRVKDKDIFFVLHTTGKMVFQESKGMEELLDTILIREARILIGTDEAGKGEWYGPLVVAGVGLTPDETLELRKLGVGDSKGLSSFRIYEIGQVLRFSRIEREVRILPPATYNKVYEQFKKEGKTLNDILSWAHTAVIHDLLERMKPEAARVVIDKFDVGGKAAEDRLGTLEKFNVTIIEKTQAESEVAVAAASVLAKYIFDEQVRTLNETYDLNLRTMNPEDVPEKVLPSVAKLHFRNVRKPI